MSDLPPNIPDGTLLPVLVEGNMTFALRIDGGWVELATGMALRPGTEAVPLGYTDRFGHEP